MLPSKVRTKPWTLGPNCHGTSPLSQMVSRHGARVGHVVNSSPFIVPIHTDVPSSPLLSTLLVRATMGLMSLTVDVHITHSVLLWVINGDCIRPEGPLLSGVLVYMVGPKNQCSVS